MFSDKYLKKFNNLLHNLDYSKNTVTKFSDYLTLSAYAIAQPFYKSEEIEKKFRSIENNYTKEQMQTFSHMLALTVETLEENPKDFLGDVFQSNDMGNQYRGQFFTPYHISLMMAKMQFLDVKEYIQKKEFITVSEPCSGAGGMIIAARQVLIDEGCNPSTDMFVEAIDIDDLCFKMSYIQFSLLGIPARVIKGNTLSMQFYEVLYTPLFFINGWKYKLNRKDEIETEILPPKAQSDKEIVQLGLFL